jgi:hypothetical protein
VELLQADLQLALAHVRGVERLIADQRAAISKLKEQGASHDKEEVLLASLLKSHEMLVRHLDHIQRLGLMRSPEDT